MPCNTVLQCSQADACDGALSRISEKLRPSSMKAVQLGTMCSSITLIHSSALSFKISGRQVSCVFVVLSVSVDSVMECQMRVNDVFCAVSSNSTMFVCYASACTASSSTAANPAWSRSSCRQCQSQPSFRGQLVPVRTMTILVVKILSNTWDLSQTWLWCKEWCHESALCVDVKCVRHLLFCNFSNNGGHFSSKGAQRRCFLFWALLLHTTIPWTYYIFIHKNVSKREGL